MPPNGGTVISQSMSDAHSYSAQLLWQAVNASIRRQSVACHSLQGTNSSRTAPEIGETGPNEKGMEVWKNDSRIVTCR